MVTTAIKTLLMPVDSSESSSRTQMQLSTLYRIFKRTQGVSTTDLVGRMLLMTKEHFTNTENEEVGLMFFC